MIDDLRSCKRPLLVSLLILIGIYLFHFQLYSHYVVFGDDPAVFAGSAGSPWQWITEGFSRYFIVYPEWTVPFTDFLRPASNLILRCEQIAFHQHYALYFAAFYFAQFLVCASVVVISYRFGVQGLWLILIGALSAISPAFLGLDLISVVFQFDVWCGLFALLALYLILDRRYYWSIFFLLLAVFTKEPTLYAPMAACFTTYSQTRRKLISAAMLLPLVAWIAVRKFIFVGSARNVYALQSGTSQFLLSLVKGITQWPSGILENLALKNILTERSISHQLPMSSFYSLISSYGCCYLLEEFTFFAGESRLMAAVQATHLLYSPCSSGFQAHSASVYSSASTRGSADRSILLN